MHIHLPALLLTLMLTPQKLSGETETWSVGLGETLTLLCDVAHEDQTLWFGQRSDEAPFLSIQARIQSYDTDALFSQFLLGASARLAVDLNTTAHSVLLKIENVTESDSALYYCASLRRGGLFFGNGTKIIISGDGRGGPPSPASPDCVLCCVHLAFVSLVCAVVCTAALCYCISQMLKKESKEDGGFEMTSRMKTRPSRSEK